MSEKVGQLSYEMPRESGGFAFDKPYSEATAQLIDSEVRDIVNNAYSRTKELLSKHKADIEKVIYLIVLFRIITRLYFVMNFWVAVLKVKLDVQYISESLKKIALIKLMM